MVIARIVEHVVHRCAHKILPRITDIKCKSIDAYRSRIVDVLVYVILLCISNLRRL